MYSMGVGLHVRAGVVIFLTLVWIQMGVRTLYHNSQFVHYHCNHGMETTDPFIGGYCIFHKKWSDWSSFHTLLVTFCGAGIYQMALTAILLLAINEMCITGLSETLSAPKVQPLTIDSNSGAD